MSEDEERHLPPEIPLSERDLTDPLLQPLNLPPNEVYDREYWEVITERGESHSGNLADVLQWVVDHRREVLLHVTLLRHREGDPK